MPVTAPAASNPNPVNPKKSIGFRLNTSWNQTDTKSNIPTTMRFLPENLATP